MKHKPQIIIAGILGNAVETFDLSIYPFLSVYLAKVFFPQQDSFLSLVNIFGIFLIGYIARPLGSLVFGRIGDIYGRKKALIASSILMTISTGMIGLLPSFQNANYLAPMLLLLFRVLQSISFGGEYTGSVIYLVEHAENHKKSKAPITPPNNLN